MSVSANQVAPDATNRQLMRVDETGFDLFPRSKDLVLTNVNANQPNCFRTVSLWNPSIPRVLTEALTLPFNPECTVIEWTVQVAWIKRKVGRWRGKLIFPQLDVAKLKGLREVGAK